MSHRCCVQKKVGFLVVCWNEGCVCRLLRPLRSEMGTALGMDVALACNNDCEPEDKNVVRAHRTTSAGCPHSSCEFRFAGCNRLPPLHDAKYGMKGCDWWSEKRLACRGGYSSRFARKAYGREFLQHLGIRGGKNAERLACSTCTEWIGSESFALSHTIETKAAVTIEERFVRLLHRSNYGW